MNFVTTAVHDPYANIPVDQKVNEMLNNPKFLAYVDLVLNPCDLESAYSTLFLNKKACEIINVLGEDYVKLGFTTNSPSFVLYGEKNISSIAALRLVNPGVFQDTQKHIKNSGIFKRVQGPYHLLSKTELTNIKISTVTTNQLTELGMTLKKGADFFIPDTDPRVLDLSHENAKTLINNQRAFDHQLQSAPSHYAPHAKVGTVKELTWKISLIELYRYYREDVKPPERDLKIN
jgi:hypothetical protein